MSRELTPKEWATIRKAEKRFAQERKAEIYKRAQLCAIRKFEYKCPICGAPKSSLDAVRLHKKLSHMEC